MNRPQRIRYLRERICDVSRGEFARGVGVHITSVYNWEKEHWDGHLTMKKYERMAQYVAERGGAVTVQWIAHGKGPLPAPAARVGDRESPSASMGTALTAGFELSPNDIALVTAAIQACFLVLLNKAPDEKDMPDLVRASLGVFLAKQALGAPSEKAAAPDRGIELPSPTSDKVPASA